jgi:2-aminophenol/2-amino-5-chlorophenol 1,6-dioxygenase alpha subunit
VRAAQRAGLASKLVDYAGFPIDSATLSAQALVNAEGTLPTLVVANNLYHTFEQTRTLGEIVAAQATAQGKRVAVLVLGGLSGSEHREQRPFSEDAIVSAGEDDWNRRILKVIGARDVDELLRQLPDFVAQARADMGFKHMGFALGALGGRLGDTDVYAYGPQYGSGAAVIRLF